MTDEYEAALHEAVFSVRADAGYLRLTGKDRADFLNRQSTNDVRALAPGRTLTTVLTSPTGRIEDVMILLDEGDVLAALTLAGRHGRTARALQGKIFFMDQVSVADASTEVEQVDLFGPKTADVLARLGVGAALEQGDVTTIDVAGSTVKVVALAGALGPGFRLVYPQALSAAVRAELASKGGRPVSDEIYEIMRVEAGLPGPDHELSDAFTPLEAGLRWAISMTKGCYTGQEIIARQINYDKVTRRLVGLRLGAEMQPGTSLKVEGRQVGVSASFVASPRFGPIALAYLKLSYAAPGTVVEAVDTTGAGMGATVVELPFTG